MAGLFWILSVIGVFVIIVWMINNEKLDDTGRTRGILAMRDGSGSAKRGPSKRRPVPRKY